MTPHDQRADARLSYAYGCYRLARLGDAEAWARALQLHETPAPAGPQAPSGAFPPVSCPAPGPCGSGGANFRQRQEG